jgi:Ran GTPase-activating protein (RanGAP) involved in mRNA processing and transport
MSTTLSVAYTAGGDSHFEENVRMDSLLSLFVRLRPLGLTMLKFYSATFSVTDLSVLASLLPSNLQHLDLSYLGLTTACVNALAKRLPRTRLKHFDISHNPIGDGSAWLLLEFIRQDADLTTLNVSYCDLTSGGTWPICNAIAQRTFDVLDISGNTIRAEGAQQIKDLLEQSPRLRVLRLDDVGLGEGDVGMIVEAAKACQSSELISVVGNDPISHQELPPFIKVDMLPPLR